MRQLVIALAVVLTGAYAWGQGDFTEGHAQGDGVRLAFRQAGAGPLIVFLHGAPDDWTLYAAQLREFSRDHLAVAPNLRGFPPSEAPPAVALSPFDPAVGLSPAARAERARLRAARDKHIADTEARLMRQH